jgi:hypothetical protein
MNVPSRRRLHLNVSTAAEGWIREVLSRKTTGGLAYSNNSYSCVLDPGVLPNVAVVGEPSFHLVPALARGGVSERVRDQAIVA